MKFINSTIILCALLTSAISTSHAAPARKIVPKGTVNLTPKSQKFAVWFPTVPEQFDQEIRAKNSDRATIFQFAAAIKKVSYLVVAASLAGVPKGEMGDLNVEEKSFLQSSGGTLLNREEISLNGFAGRELLVKSPIGRYGRVRIFITPKFHYVLLVQGEQTDAKKQSAQINRFFDSFRILP